jgi:hypothetical protein
VIAMNMPLASARQALATMSKLPEETQAAATDTGRNSMLVRSLHWVPPLQEIDKATGSTSILQAYLRLKPT